MQRKQYRITSTVGHDIVKSAWNSANREVERLAGVIANEVGANYNLIDKVSVKEGYDHVQGTRSWQNSKTGVIVVFTIVKEA